jgi:hypothetical protein
VVLFQSYVSLEKNSGLRLLWGALCCSFSRDICFSFRTLLYSYTRSGFGESHWLGPSIGRSGSPSSYLSKIDTDFIKTHAVLLPKDESQLVEVETFKLGSILYFLTATLFWFVFDSGRLWLWLYSYNYNQEVKELNFLQFSLV